jgi:hemerythrin-like metal-binding protein
MSLIEWRDEFSVGIPEVDHEHQQLVGLINDLHDAMSGENATMAVTDFLGEIHAHVAAHFALEEKIMRERHYDQYQDHKQDHERLLDDISDIMDAYEENDFYSDKEFASTLEYWFTNHFKTRDARLHKHLGV